MAARAGGESVCPPVTSGQDSPPSSEPGEGDTPAEELSSCSRRPTTTGDSRNPLELANSNARALADAHSSFELSSPRLLPSELHQCTQCPYTLSLQQHRRFLVAALEGGLDAFCGDGGSEGAGGGEAFSTRLHLEGVGLSGVYWSLAGLSLLRISSAEASPAFAESETERSALDSISSELKERLVSQFVLKCLRTVAVCQCAQRGLSEGGVFNSVPGNSASSPASLGEGARGGSASEACGFASSPVEGFAPASLPTCSGLQALALTGCLGRLSPSTLEKIRRFLLALQRPDGAFANSLPPPCVACKGGLKRPRRKDSNEDANFGHSPPTANFADAEDFQETLGEEFPPREGDVRSTLCCLASLRIIEEAQRVSVGEASSVEATNAFRGVEISSLIDWLLACQNLDGGFGVSPGAESHAGAAFCVASCLALLRQTEALNASRRNRLERWLAHRQTAEGGLQGRLGKQADVCYAWWICAALQLTGRPPGSPGFLNGPSLAAFVFRCQDTRHGGFSRAPQQRPRDSDDGTASAFGLLARGVLDDRDEAAFARADPFHTFFGLAGLSVLAHAAEEALAEEPRGGPGAEVCEENKWRTRCREQLWPLDCSVGMPLHWKKTIKPLP